MTAAQKKESYVPQALDFPSLGFDLGETAELLRGTVRDFAQGEIAPRAALALAARAASLCSCFFGFLPDSVMGGFFMSGGEQAAEQDVIHSPCAL